MKQVFAASRWLTVAAVASWFNPVQAAEYKWTDAAGAHAVTFATTEQGDDVHLRVIGTLNGQPDWSVRDDVTECGEDKVLDVVPASVEMPDLLGNGRRQFLFAYKIGCRGDVSPDAVKYFLIDQGKKYVLRGEEVLTHQGRRFDGGAAPVPNADLKANPAFLRYMTKRWRGVSVRNYD
ncbi:hypothetical protein BLA6860_03959 [Burkholderia lata]|uniref:M949_RS01915 family surface polysaccharide biosynthesis protein n=1 Tax=Burkholderia lata (strain ATCC 17760 / DSM 23089 / LMG 22485 / NCIMB 9086 / R18194 / 383) TaxID=482957 RepID=UPI001453F692|nr:DUF4124 domain-containing protein [Burkholderia lata]VWB83628.1 hypothetical protein BLA6860_03959 [Burkholderia lata]